MISTSSQDRQESHLRQMQAQNRTCRILRRGCHPTPACVVQRKAADKKERREKAKREKLRSSPRENPPVPGLSTSPQSCGVGLIRNLKAQLRAHAEDKGETSGRELAVLRGQVKKMRSAFSS